MPVLEKMSWPARFRRLAGTIMKAPPGESGRLLFPARMLSCIADPRAIGKLSCFINYINNSNLSEFDQQMDSKRLLNNILIPVSYKHPPPDLALCYYEKPVG